jgi:hypothetical protein
MLPEVCPPNDRSSRSLHEFGKRSSRHDINCSVLWTTWTGWCVALLDVCMHVRTSMGPCFFAGRVLRSSPE